MLCESWPAGTRTGSHGSRNCHNWSFMRTRPPAAGVSESRQHRRARQHREARLSPDRGRHAPVMVATRAGGFHPGQGESCTASDTVSAKLKCWSSPVVTKARRTIRE